MSTAADLARWISEAAPALRGAYVHRVWRAGTPSEADERWVLLARHHDEGNPSARAVGRVALQFALTGEVARFVALPPEDVQADDKKLKARLARAPALASASSRCQP